MRTPSIPLLSLSLLSTALIACDDAPAPSEVRARIASDLGYILTEGQAAMEGGMANLPSGAAFSFLGASLETTPIGRVVAPVMPQFAPRPDKHVVYSTEPESELDTDAIIAFLNTQIFTDANHAGDGVYRIPAALVCERTEWDLDGNPSTSIDPECVTEFDKVQLRIRVADEGANLRFYLQVTKNHVEPLSVLLGKKKLAVTVNLDDASSATIELAALAGEQAPNAQLAGQVTAAIEILGAAHGKASFSIDRALSIKFADQGASLDGPDAFRLASAAGEVVALELDGNAASAALSLGLGATTVHVPGDEYEPGATELALGGATLHASLAGDTLTLADLSLGTTTTTLKKDGALAMSIDLNPDDGRKLTATLTSDATTGLETLAVSPRLDLRTSIDHAVLGEPAPTYTVTRVQLDGSLRGGDETDQIEVLTGSFAITTDPAQYGFSATAGQCVTATEVFDNTTYDSYTQFTVGACP
jgi:hypothetical protein